MTRAKAKKRSTVDMTPTKTSSKTPPKTARTGEEYGRLTHAGLAWSPLLRLVGRDRALQVIIAHWAAGAEEHAPNADASTVPAPTLARPMVTTSSSAEDYAQIDLKLAIQSTPILSEEPRPGTGYAGFTPTQRYHFLQWLGHVDLDAPVAFRQLYLAHLETNLFDQPLQRQAAHQELCRLAAIPAWQSEDLVWRALLLSFCLTAQGEELGRWLATAARLPLPLLGIAFGQLALLGQPLTVEQLPLLLQRWQIADQLLDRSILQLRLGFLTNSLGVEPLAHLRGQLDDAALAPKPWRCAHRDLRLRLVQPDLRQGFVPLLRELNMLTEYTPIAVEQNDDDGDGTLLIAEEEAAPSYGTGRQKSGTKPKAKWQLVLEFGDSRSDLFTVTLNQAKRMPGYLQIMDENRHMIHRVHFEKAELRRFWVLWEYVQSWSSTQVYINGKELQKWEIYPYSPYLR